ncbi:hypothetical protein BH23GEM2_BH23GEM2_07090 [soil metagenome]
MSHRPIPLLEALRRESALERTRRVAASVLLMGATMAVLLALIVTFLGGGRWIALPPYLPVLMLAFAILLGGMVLAFAWRSARRATRPARLARAVEIERQLRRGSVSGLLEIGDTPIAARAAARLAGVVPAHDPAPMRRYRSRRLLLAGGAAVVLASAAFTWSGAQNPDGIVVLRHPVLAASGGLLEPLKIHGAPRSVRRGNSVTVDISARQRHTVRLHKRVAGTGWEVASHRVVDGKASVDLGPVTSAVVLFASDARGRTDTLVIAPADRPFVQELVLRAVYPEYLGRADELLPAEGRLVVPAGTELRIAGTASEPLSAVTLYDDSRLIQLRVTDAQFVGGTTLHRSTVLHWRMAARSGDEVETPRPLQVAVIPDEPPEVDITTPAADTSVSGDTPVRVTVRAADDHELAAVSLMVRRGDAEEIVPLQVPAAGGSAGVLLDLSSIEPGGRVAVRAIAIEATGAARRTISAPRMISLFTAGEQREAARLAADSAAALAAGMVVTQRQVERSTVEVSRARGDRREPESVATASAAGHALASRARTIVEEQRGLSSRADSLAAATRALESRLARAGALDEGLAARLAEVRSLLQRALTPELAAGLRDAENAARDDAEEPLRRALADVALEQRRTREQLERVVGMLRRAAIEGSLETLRAEAAELAQQAANPRQREAAAARRQTGSELAARTRQLQRDIAGVVSKLEEVRARAGVEPARTAAGRAERAAGALAAGTIAGAATALDGSAESLAAARAAQITEWKQEIAADLDAAVQELVQLATAESELARRVAGGSGEWRDEHAALEEAATVVAERITRAARTSTLVSSRSDGLVRAARDGVVRVSAQSFPPRDRTQTSALMRDAATSLSRAAASLVRDRERTNSARSASGFTELLEELQRLANQQRGLNAASAGLPLGLAGAGSGETRDRARTLARQQREIARALEGLGDADGGARAQPLAAEANRVADALERAAVDASVLARQERLYHRLLQGGRLLTGDSGEDEDRREAVAAGSTTLPLVLESRAESRGARRHQIPGWAELRTLTPSERQMIVEYFERLNDSGR